LAADVYNIKMKKDGCKMAVGVYKFKKDGSKIAADVYDIEKDRFNMAVGVYNIKKDGWRRDDIEDAPKDKMAGMRNSRWRQSCV